LSRLEGPKRDKLINDAKKHCRTALEIDRYNAKAYGCLGVIAFTQSAFLDAEFYFRKSIEVNPSEGSHVELGSLFCQMGSYPEATAMLLKAVELNPGDARAYIELGNVAVYEEDNKKAIKYCRQALLVDPKNAETHRALAIALMRAEQYDEAEFVVRKALRALASSRAWRLNLLLAQILVRNADDANKERKKKDLDLYKEALGYVNQAKQARSPNPDILFHLGIVQSRLEDLLTSHKCFDECLKLNRDRFDAERNSRIVQAAIAQQRQLFKVNEMFSYILALVCVVMLGLLWAAYLRGDKRSVPVEVPTAGATAASTPVPKDEFVVDRPLLNLMTPILLGLLTVAALLPNLSKLKMPGFEAEITEPKTPDPNISTGPRGEIGFGSSLPIIDPEPR
jgi:tetratricopeptide (TPR) repeat protein